MVEYEESIQYLRETKGPDFKELQVHEELVQELEAKPYSWLSRNDIETSKKRIDFTAEERKEKCVLPLSNASKEKE